MTKWARLTTRPTRFGVCHYSVLRASHTKVHNAIVALAGAELRLGSLSHAFMRSTVRDLSAEAVSDIKSAVSVTFPHR